MSLPHQVPALHGLRGLAVMAVVGYHFFPDNLHGGFLGVDVFFVLSGYLITSGLLRFWNRYRRLDLRGFWIRRFRRLFPALLFMLLCTLLPLMLIGGDAGTRLRPQVLGALTFSSNWFQIASGDSYFNRSAPPVFQHLWSLALEEQFYILWPVLLWLAMLTATKWLGPKAQPVGVLAGCLAVASFAFMVHGTMTGGDPSRQYYGTDSHSFGLLLGAGAATVPSAWIGRFSGRRVRIACIVCLLAVAAAVVLLPDDAAFVYRGGIFGVSIATAAAVAILGAVPVVGKSRGVVRFLEGEALQWVGLRSYGIYLWHWPLLVLGRQSLGFESDLATALLFIPMTIVMAAISYTWIEMPINRQGFGIIQLKWQQLLHRNQMRSRSVASAASIALVAVLVASTAAVLSSPNKTELQTQIDSGASAIASASANNAPTAAPLPHSQVHSPTPSESPSGIHAQGDSEDPAGQTKPSPEKAQLSSALADGSDTSAIGDSVMLASAPSLISVMPLMEIHAQIGFQTWDAPPLLAKLRAQGSLRKNVVIGLGANGDFSETTLKEVLSELGPNRQLTLLTAHGSQPWTAAANENMRRFADTHPRVRLLDWDKVSAKVPDFAPDGVHPGPQGALIYAQLLAEGLTH